MNKEYCEYNTTYSCDFDKLTDLNVLYNAFQKCKNGVYWKASVQKYELNLLLNLYRLRKRLINGTYRQHSFDEFDICERGKHRHIKALHIEDRVVQRALCDEILIPKLTPYLIHDNGANIKNKGVSFARRRLRDQLRNYYINNNSSNEGYILQLDIQKYFDSIPQDKAYHMIAEHIDDSRINELIWHLISSFSNDGVGIGIGSQISQIIGTFYLHKFDNFIKICKGCKYYARYSDDMYIIKKDKKELTELISDIEDKLSTYGLQLSQKKTCINKIDTRFVFLKVIYFLTPSGKVVMIPHKSGFTRERHKLKSFCSMCNSGVMDPTYAQLQYSSWRGNLTSSKKTTLNYKSNQSLARTDELFNTLFKSADLFEPLDFYKSVEDKI